MNNRFSSKEEEEKSRRGEIPWNYEDFFIYDELFDHSKTNSDFDDLTRFMIETFGEKTGYTQSIRVMFIEIFLDVYENRLESDALVIIGKSKRMIKPELIQALCALPFSDMSHPDGLVFDYDTVIQVAKQLKEIWQKHNLEE